MASALIVAMRQRTPSTPLCRIDFDTPSFATHLHFSRSVE
jgi:hypothetical protein